MRNRQRAKGRRFYIISFLRLFACNQKMDQENNARQPIVFAGQKFYDLLIEQMRYAGENYILGYYGVSLSFLRQIYNMTCAFIVHKEELNKELCDLEHAFNTHLICQRNRGYDILNKEAKLKKQILQYQMKLYCEIKDLILKTGGTEADTVGLDSIMKGTI